MSARRNRASWLDRRRERERLERLRKGDTPEKQAEDARTHDHPDADDPVAQASIGGAVNQAATHM